MSCDCLARDKMRMFAFSISRLSPRRLIESAKCALAFCLLKLRNYPVWAEGVKNSANNSDNNRRRCSKKSISHDFMRKAKKKILDEENILLCRWKYFFTHWKKFFWPIFSLVGAQFIIKFDLNLRLNMNFYEWKKWQEQLKKFVQNYLVFINFYNFDPHVVKFCQKYFK